MMIWVSNFKREKNLTHLSTFGKDGSQSQMVVTMYMADKNALQIPQHFPSIPWHILVNAKTTSHLTPSSLSCVKQDVPIARDFGECRKHIAVPCR